MLENGSYCSKKKDIFLHYFLSDGSEIAGSTLMEILLMNDFKVVINKVTYDVRCPKKGKKHSYAILFVFPFSYGALSFSSRGVNKWSLEVA